jgi:hypothetical protein
MRWGGAATDKSLTLSHKLSIQPSIEWFVGILQEHRADEFHPEQEKLKKSDFQCDRRLTAQLARRGICGAISFGHADVTLTINTRTRYDVATLWQLF